MAPLHLDPAELACLLRSVTDGPVFGCRPEDLPTIDDPQSALLRKEGARKLEERGLVQRDAEGGYRLPPDVVALVQRIARPRIGVLLIRRSGGGQRRFLYQADTAGFSRTRVVGAGRWEVQSLPSRQDCFAAILADIGELPEETPPEQAELTFSLTEEAILGIDRLVRRGRRLEALDQFAHFNVPQEAATRWLYASQNFAAISALLFARCQDDVIEDVYSLSVVQSHTEAWLVQATSPDNPRLQVAPTKKGEVSELVERYYNALASAEPDALKPPNERR